MKKYILFCLVSLGSLLGYSQENVTGLYDDRGKSVVTIDTVSTRGLGVDMISPRMDAESKWLLFENYYSRTRFDYQTPPIYFNQYVGGINPNLYYSISGANEYWPGITVINNASFNLHSVYDRLIFTVGTDLWRYDNLGRPFTDVTFHGDVAYEVLPWLTLGAYGQYSLFSKQNVKDGSALHMPMIPFTGYGVHSKVMFNSTFGIEGGVGRQFNPIKNKWESTYGVGPVIEFKRKRR